MWNSKGRAFYILEKYKEAIKCYDKALEIDPNYIDALNDKDLAVDKLEKWKNVKKYYGKAKQRLGFDPSETR